MSDEKVLDELKEIFKNVNNWLNFAELKNGMIIVFNTTCIINIIEKNMKDYLGWYYFAILMCFSLSLILAMLSFSPKVKNIYDKWPKINKRFTPEKNMLFFGDIFQLSSSEYIKMIYKEYYNKEIDVSSISKIQINYADEIVVNSKIAVSKYSMFNKSLFVAIIGVILTFLSQLSR